MMRRPALFTRREKGFNLIELSIAMALMGLGFAFMSQMFLNSYRLWKKSFDTLVLQGKARHTVAFMVRHLREGHPGSVELASPSGRFSEITFRDGREKFWVFRKTGDTIQYIASYSWGGSSTNFMMSRVETLAFTYPNFQDTGLIEVALTASQVPYSNGEPIVVQVLERVLMREP